MKKEYVSEERYQELRGELNSLKTKGRAEVAQELKTAKELGDLSENSAYQEAREEQSRLERRISQLEELLKNITIIKKVIGEAVIRVGSKVKVRRAGEIINYQIVGSQESDPAQGLISNESPIGRNFLGKKVKDVFKVKTPKGESVFEILAID